MWTSTVGLVNGKHRYLTAETFGFKINSNGQMLKKRQQWTIEPFPDNFGPDGSISSAASVSSQSACQPQLQAQAPLQLHCNQPTEPGDPCILTFNPVALNSSLSSMKSSSNGSSTSDGDACGEEHESVAIRSHLNKYLAVDSFGNVTCDSDEKTENARFTITVCSMSQGRSKEEQIFWAFKNVERGYYLGTTEDGMICCNAKTPKSRAELWHLHLIPARGASVFALKSLGRSRYARLVELDEREGGFSQVQLDATVSWGPETLFQFKYQDGGRYSILTSDCRYLTVDGKCIQIEGSTNDDSIDSSIVPPAECLFTLEYHSGFLALRDAFGHYLAAAGRSSVLKSRSPGVSRDELFVFESAPIQVSFKATFNGRYVSIKQGVDVSANQSEVSSRHETFQLTYHKQTDNWSIMTFECNFWTVSQGTSTISVCSPADYEGLARGQFKLHWADCDDTCSLKYVSAGGQERWIAARKSGQLYLSSGSQEPVRFVMHFENRRLLNLRPASGQGAQASGGFVGLRPGGGSRALEANKTAAEPICIEYIEAEAGASAAGRQADGANADQEDLATQRTNMFNVKLNSTRMGQSILHERQSNGPPVPPKMVQRVAEAASKEIELAVDSNNNDTDASNCAQTDQQQTSAGVELASAPSVASIISSFSNTRLGGADEQRTPTRQSSSGASILRLAATFAPSGQHSDCKSESADTAELAAGDKGARAQSDFCYLRCLANKRYLRASDDQSSVTCDASSRSAAQAWLLQLRGHNCVAIRASDTQAYVQLGANGIIHLSRCRAEEASLWEF